MKQIPTNKKINKIGKYLYKNIDSAYKFKTSSNMCDVYMTVYYEYEYPGQSPSDNKERSDLMEMGIDINITTYQNKIRVNLYEVTPNEATVSYMRYDPEELVDLDYAQSLILRDVRKSLEKRYEDYEFIF